MKNLNLAALLFAIALTLANFLEAGAQRLELSRDHRRWLGEEVVYIITDREKEFFLSLETFEEREGFIAAFWRKRDPDPATPENEFKEEHYRRIEFANTELGKETVQPGWTTERGRMYIILGEPRSVERFVGEAEVVTCELWTYQGVRGTRLPPHFYLLFYKRFDSEDYRIYSPAADGPTKLILGGRSGLESDTRKALEILYERSYDLAFASLSLDLGQPPDFASAQPLIASDIILAQAEDAAKYTVRTDYIDTYLRYGKRVSADYSFNFIPSRSVFALLAGPEGAPFLHYSIELDPQNFTFATDDDRSRYYTTLDVVLEVRTKEGTLVHASEKEIFVELNPQEFDQFRAFPFAYQDDVPLVPGDFQVSVILRNRTVKQYTLVEREVRVVPLSTEAPGLAGPVLGYRIETSEIPADGPALLTFQVDPYRVYPATEATFTIGETAHIFAQVIGQTDGLSLRFRLIDKEQVLQESSVPVDELLSRVATASRRAFESGRHRNVRSRGHGGRALRGAGRAIGFRGTSGGAGKNPRGGVTPNRHSSSLGAPPELRYPRPRTSRSRPRRAVPGSPTLQRGRAGARESGRGGKSRPAPSRMAASRTLHRGSPTGARSGASSSAGRAVS
jgi:GWxTD domain-containing protein